MALETSKRRRSRLSMTSLIDVIFLLLLFFMLTSTFSKYGDVEIVSSAPGAGGSSDVEQVFLSLKPSGILLNAEVVTLDSLKERLKKPHDKERIVLVSLSNAIKSQELVDVLAVLRDVPGLQPMVLQ
jgi:biopolymer transport protein ExbD